MRASWIAVALLVSAPLGVLAGALKIDPKRGCRLNPALVGPCFEVEGRAVAANGSPSMRIMRRGTRRLLGVLPSESEIAPACLRREVSFQREVAGRFTVCPFTRDKPGAMQMVCVQGVSDAVVRPVNPHDTGRIPARKLPDCSLADEAN